MKIYMTMFLPPLTSLLKWLLACILCFLICLPTANTQTIKNVRTTFDQSDQKMFIQYELKSWPILKKIQVRITPYIVSDDTLKLHIHTLSGDTGWISFDGKKRLIWEPFKDGVTSLKDVKIDLKKEIRKSTIPSYLVIELQGSNTAPLGIRVIQYNGVGYYAGFRMGYLPPVYRYTVNNLGEMDYLESGVYKIGSQKRLSSYAITGGITISRNRKSYIYAGMGYGATQLFWKYEAFNLDKQSTGNYWALNKNRSKKGVILELGLGRRWGPILISFGASYLGSLSASKDTHNMGVEFTWGIGYSLSDN